MAAKATCDIMNERLAPFKKERPDATWREVSLFILKKKAKERKRKENEKRKEEAKKRKRERKKLKLLLL